MFRTRVSLILIAALSAPACAKDKPAPAKPAKPTIELGTSEVVHLQVSIESLGDVPNSGLLLPEVSPDGARIVYLKLVPLPAASPSAEVSPDSLVTGKGLGGVSLEWRELKRGGVSRVVCPAGAAWPVWFPDGKHLAFVVYDSQGRASLAIHDLERGETKRWGVGVKHVMMPAVSPDGRRVVVTGYSDSPAEARLIMVEPDAGKTELGPVVAAATTQLGPQWLDANTLIFVGLGKASETSTSGQPLQRVLYAWSIGANGGPGAVKALRPMNVSGEPVEFLQAFLGIGGPVNASADRLAYYDAMNDAISLIHLTGDETRSLPRGTRSGVWLGNARFAAATEKELSLYSAKDDRWQSVIEGTWLPRWADEKRGTMVLLGASKAGSGFEVDRLTLRAADSPNSTKP